MNTATQSIVVGILAGIASAMLALSAATMSFVSIILSFCAIIPVLLAGIGWSNRAGVVAALTGALVVGLALSPLSAFSLAVTSLLPGAWIAHLSNLARPADEIGGPEGELAWYPLGSILLYICGISAAIIVIQNNLPGVAEFTRVAMEQQIDVIMAQNPELQSSGISNEGYVDTILRVAPAVQSFGAVLILFFAWYLTMAIARISGRAKRPRDDVPSSLRLPRMALLFLAVGVLLCFAGESLSPIGFAIAGAFAAGFTLSGLAMLHFATRGKPWRFPLLWFAYAAVFIASMAPLLIFFIAGLFGSTRTAAIQSTTNNNDTTT